MDKIFMIIFLATVCDASIEKKTHYVVHVDTEITCSLTMKDIFNHWKDDIINTFSNEYRQRAFEFCLGITGYFLSSEDFTAGNYEDCRVLGFRSTSDIDNKHVVTVEFVLSFEGSDYSNIKDHVDNVINKNDYLRFDDNYFKKLKYNRVSAIIVYNTHQGDDNQNIALRSALTGTIVTAYNSKMESVKSRRYILEKIPMKNEGVESERLLTKNNGRMVTGRLLSTQKLDGPESEKRHSDDRLNSAIHHTRTNNMKHISLDADEDLLKRLSELQEKLEHAEMKK